VLPELEKSPWAEQILRRRGDTIESPWWGSPSWVAKLVKNGLAGAASLVEVSTFLAGERVVFENRSVFAPEEAHQSPQ